MSQFKGRTVAILGVSVEGLDAVRFFVREGAQVTCCDQRSAENLGDTYKALKDTPVSIRLGNGYLDGLSQFDYVVRTPGMSPRLPALVALRANGREITSATKLFFELCRAPIIGITGTKGKGTTSTLISSILKADGKRVWLGGNVGIPLLSRLGDITARDFVVFELSSFQLEDLTRSPHVAVVLKITQEHLANFDALATNFHPTIEIYREAKKQIVRYQTKSDFLVCNRDDPVSASFANITPAHAYFFSRKKADADAYIEDHTVYVRWNGKTERICRALDVKLRGDHNLENIAAASLASRIVHANISSIRSAVRQFDGLPHRIQFVRTVDGVSYFDDSCSTIPETAIAAIGSFRQPIILILGGSEKGSDFRDLGTNVATQNVRAVVVIGDMTTRIVAALHDAGYNGKIITKATSMAEAVHHARRVAVSGDVVLLSPACASFDMFRNFKDRGDQFTYEVTHLSSHSK